METKAGCDLKLATCRSELTRAIEAAEARATTQSEQRLAQVVEQHLKVPALIGYPGDPYSNLPDYLVRTKASMEHDLQRISRRFEEMTQRVARADETAEKLQSHIKEQVATLEERFP